MKKILILLLTLTSVLGVSAQKQFELPLWQGKPAEKSTDAADTAKVFVYLP